MLGFMIVTAFISMWITNTATTAMMTPIMEAVLKQLDEELEIESKQTKQGYIEGKGAESISGGGGGGELPVSLSHKLDASNFEVGSTDTELIELASATVETETNDSANGSRWEFFFLSYFDFWIS